MKISNIPPFTIEELPLDDATSNPLLEGQDAPNLKQNYGYYIRSTGNIHVDDPPLGVSSETVSGRDRSVRQIAEIAEHSIKAEHMVIAIHGYSVSDENARKWYSQIFAYIAGRPSEAAIAPTGALDQVAAAAGRLDIANIRNSIQKSVFLGYRWPAEPRNSAKGRYAFEALPTLLLGIFLSAFVLGIATYSLLVTQNFLIWCLVGAIAIGLSIYVITLSKSFNLVFTAIAGTAVVALCVALFHWNAPGWLIGLISIISFFVVASVGMLILLRLLTYSRDRYRASNYGTIDLVELVRQLDQHIHEKISPDKKIILSFVAHSLGCEVLTQAIRILSDVFDPQAISQKPNQELGESFILGRLVLVAPDIPVESILQGRGNFLKSSLRRAKESYVFSNEADLALRVASTAANYISFPAKSRFRGYKLGNITAQHFRNRHDQTGYKPNYDADSSRLASDPPFPGQSLEIRASKVEHLNLLELSLLERAEQDPSELTAELCRHLLLVANRFTYFDCTDYIDIHTDYAANIQSSRPTGVVSFAEKASALNFLNYIRLVFPYLRDSDQAKLIDVHGGYFKGEFTQNLIYGLAFLGQQRFLEAAKLEDVSELKKQCFYKQIQVIWQGTQARM
ncbi:MAG: alpha/beta hydrolase [Phormidesmis sp.]